MNAITLTMNHGLESINETREDGMKDIQDPFGDVLVTPADVSAFVENGVDGLSPEVSKLIKSGEATIIVE